MQVILLRDVSGIGQKGQVKNVSDGHALNHLIPNRLAEIATPDKLKAYEKQKADEAKANEIRDKEWSSLAKQLNGTTITLKANAAPQGHLYEKVSGLTVSAAIREQLKLTVPPAAIEPKMAIKEIGDWPVEIKLGAHTARIILAVVRR